MHEGCWEAFSPIVAFLLTPPSPMSSRPFFPSLVFALVSFVGASLVMPALGGPVHEPLWAFRRQPAKPGSAALVPGPDRY